jgi:hypothetical protein
MKIYKGTFKWAIGKSKKKDKFVSCRVEKCFLDRIFLERIIQPLLLSSTVFPSKIVHQNVAIDNHHILLFWWWRSYRTMWMYGI